ncbi:16679_t:CDS:2, partial [Cetraspora pellucida]
GNGYERDLANNSKVHIVDVFNSLIYPQDHEAIACTSTSIPLSSPELKHDDKYLPLIQANIFQSFHKFQGDPLGAMNLSSDAILKRDELVFRMALEHGIPIAMVLSGGYQKKNAEIIASSILNLIKKFDLLRKHKSSDKSLNSP